MTDYSKLTNAEIDALVAEKVMGWIEHEDDEAVTWLAPGGTVGWTAVGPDRWSPTTIAHHSAYLQRYLIETGYWLNVGRFPSDAGCEWAGLNVAMMCLGSQLQTSQGDEDRFGSAHTSIADDPNGFRCLCIAALQAKIEAVPEIKDLRKRVKESHEELEAAWLELDEAWRFLLTPDPQSKDEVPSE